MEQPEIRHGSLRKWTALLLIVTGLVVAGLMMLSTNASTALGKVWTTPERVSFAEIDHSAFDALLKKYVDVNGYVDYAAWKASAADRGALTSYFDELSRADTGQVSSDEARIAFWINAYNAVTLEGILRVYPTASIRDHTSLAGGYNIWKHLPLRVGDEQFSLEQIEHEQLRPLGEPRIHFAIVCASVGCPRLLNEAYTAEKLEEQLAANTADFFSRPENLKVAGGALHLSSILNWYAEDFGDDRKLMLMTLTRYFPDSAARFVDQEHPSDVKVEYLDYDWSLNDQARRP